jgi:glycosyltransferase involved in cell wall biosynthesis
MGSDSGNKPLVVFFHPYFSDGGVERTNIGLSKELIKNGYKVSFVTINPTDHFVDEVSELGIEFIVLPSKTTLASQPALVKWLRKKNKEFDSVVVISCQYYVNILCLLFRPFWGRNIHHILSERNHFDEFKVKQHCLKQKIIMWLIPALYRFAENIMANSSELADDLGKITGRKISVIYNPTINPRLLQLSQEKIIEDWYLQAKRPIILAVGRLSLQKDFDTLINAFAKLKPFHDASLIILGEGAEKERLSKLIVRHKLQSSVIMPGFVKNPYKFMGSADLFVLSSVYEGLPNVLIEALSMGTSVVSTSCRSGPTEILNDGRFGSLVPVGNDDAIFDAMKLVLDKPQDAQDKTSAAATSLKRYTPEAVGVEFIKLVNNIMSSNDVR